MTHWTSHLGLFLTFRVGKTGTRVSPDYEGRDTTCSKALPNKFNQRTEILNFPEYFAN